MRAQVIFWDNLLLYCIEKTSQSYKAYFVDFQTLQSAQPRMCCFWISQRQASDFIPGCLFRLEVDKKLIKSYQVIEDYIITEPYYQMLMQLHARLYKEKSAQDFIATDYYPFIEYRSLISYRETLGQNAIRILIQFLIQLLSVFMPVSGYIVALVYANKVSSQYPLPILAISFLPLCLWLSVALNTIFQNLLCRWSYTRYAIMRNYTLRQDGKRLHIRTGLKSYRMQLVIGVLCTFAAITGLFFTIRK